MTASKGVGRGRQGDAGTRGVSGRSRRCLVCDRTIRPGQDGILLLRGGSQRNADVEGWLCLRDGNTVMDVLALQRKRIEALDFPAGQE